MTARPSNHKSHRRARWLVALALFVLAGFSPAAATARAPGGFFGVVPQGPLSARDFERMRGLGLSLRVPFYWSQIESERGRFDFSVADEVVRGAVARGVRVTPFVYGSPPWVSAHHARPPLGSPAAQTAWASFLGRLVDRYGPGGSLWRGAGARRPIRSWQVWNEPNFVVFWRPRPSARGYARLLRISAGAIRARDPGARIVAAGVAPIEGGLRPAEFLRRLYRVPGVTRDFDVAALHPYSPVPRGVEYQVRQVRRVMARAGDGRTPLLLSELGVASDAQRPSPMNRGRRGQAQFVERVFGRLVEMRDRWRISGADWFTWQDGPVSDRYCVFCQHAGLFDLDGNPKPAWTAFRRAVLAAGEKAVR